MAKAKRFDCQKSSDSTVNRSISTIWETMWYSFRGMIHGNRCSRQATILPMILWLIVIRVHNLRGKAFNGCDTSSIQTRASISSSAHRFMFTTAFGAFTSVMWVFQQSLFVNFNLGFPTVRNQKKTNLHSPNFSGRWMFWISPREPLAYTVKSGPASNVPELR